jgi:hypothetical protein
LITEAANPSEMQAIFTKPTKQGIVQAVTVDAGNRVATLLAANFSR